MALSLRVSTPGRSVVSTALAQQRARIIAAFRRGAVVAAPNWSATANVIRGRSVTMPGGIINTFTSAGQTGSSAPAYSAASPVGRPVVDGSAVAYATYEKNANPAPSRAPTITQYASAAAAGLTETQLVVGNALNSNVMVCGATSLPHSPGVMAMQLAWANHADQTGNADAQAIAEGFSSVYAYAAYAYEVEFNITDSVVAWTTAGNASPLTVEVNDELLQADSLFPLNSAGSCTVADYGGTVETRRVRMTFSYNTVLRGVALTVNGYLSPSDQIPDPGIAWGDSQVQTISDPGNNKPITTFAQLFRRNLGLTALIDAGIGGSSYTIQTNTVFSTLQALANPENQRMWQAQNPTHGFFFTSYNDVQGYVAAEFTLATLQARAQDAWSLARSLFPNAKLTVTDGFCGSRGPSNATLEVAAALKSQFIAWNDPNTRFVPIIGDSVSSSIIQGTADAGTAIGLGNSCVMTGTDKTHPTPWGAAYIAPRVADRVAVAWAGNY